MTYRLRFVEAGTYAVLDFEGRVFGHVKQLGKKQYRAILKITTIEGVRCESFLGGTRETVIEKMIEKRNRLIELRNRQRERIDA